jgi:hypothetical protein
MQHNIYNGSLPLDGYPQPVQQGGQANPALVTAHVDQQSHQQQSWSTAASPQFQQTQNLHLATTSSVPLAPKLLDLGRQPHAPSFLLASNQQQQQRYSQQGLSHHYQEQQLPGLNLGQANLSRDPRKLSSSDLPPQQLQQQPLPGMVTLEQLQPGMATNTTAGIGPATAQRYNPPALTTQQQLYQQVTGGTLSSSGAMPQSQYHQYHLQQQQQQPGARQPWQQQYGSAQEQQHLPKGLPQYTTWLPQPHNQPPQHHHHQQQPVKAGSYGSYGSHVQSGTSYKPQPFSSVGGGNGSGAPGATTSGRGIAVSYTPSPTAAPAAATGHLLTVSQLAPGAPSAPAAAGSLAPAQGHNVFQLGSSSHQTLPSGHGTTPSRSIIPRDPHAPINAAAAAAAAAKLPKIDRAAVAAAAKEVEGLVAEVVEEQKVDLAATSSWVGVRAEGSMGSMKYKATVVSR